MGHTPELSRPAKPPCKQTMIEKTIKAQKKSNKTCHSVLHPLYFLNRTSQSFVGIKSSKSLIQQGSGPRELTRHTTRLCCRSVATWSLQERSSQFQCPKETGSPGVFSSLLPSVLPWLLLRWLVWSQDDGTSVMTM